MSDEYSTSSYEIVTLEAWILGKNKCSVLGTNSIDSNISHILFSLSSANPLADWWNVLTQAYITPRWLVTFFQRHKTVGHLSWYVRCMYVSIQTMQWCRMHAGFDKHVSHLMQFTSLSRSSFISRIAFRYLHASSIPILFVTCIVIIILIIIDPFYT